MQSVNVLYFFYVSFIVLIDNTIQIKLSINSNSMMLNGVLGIES